MNDSKGTQASNHAIQQMVEKEKECDILKKIFILKNEMRVVCIYEPY